jgi:hypothetical protein
MVLMYMILIPPMSLCEYASRARPARALVPESRSWVK